MHTQPHVTQFSLLISPCVPHHLSEQNFPRLMFQRTSDKRRVNFLVHKVSCFYWKDRQNWDCNRQRGAPLIQKETQLIPNVQIPVYGKKKASVPVVKSATWKTNYNEARRGDNEVEIPVNLNFSWNYNLCHNFRSRWEKKAFQKLCIKLCLLEAFHETCHREYWNETTGKTFDGETVKDVRNNHRLVM